MSNIKLLCNHAGSVCSSLTAEGTSDDDITNLIAGARSRTYRIDQTSSDRRILYDSSVAWAYDFFYIARADKFLTSNTMGIYLGDEPQNDGVYVDQEQILSFASSDLIGIDNFNVGHGQDYVFLAGTPKFTFSASFKTTSAGSVARECSKFYVGLSFDFGTAPTIIQPPQMQYLPRNFTFTPLQSTLKHECEARFSLTWLNVTDAKLRLFEELPQILKWPLVLYDVDQTIFEHKLEHVLIENYQIRRNTVDSNDVTINFLRLRHYP